MREETRKCYMCGGTGKIEKIAGFHGRRLFKCKKCKGTGRIPHRLTREQAAAVLAVEGGADVLDMFLASTLRQIAQLPGSRMVDICKPMNNYSGLEKLPYFGCIATPAGIKAARTLLSVEGGGK